MKESLSPRTEVQKKKKIFCFCIKKVAGIEENISISFSYPIIRPISRMAVVVGKRVGNAVKRNKIKRWMTNCIVEIKTSLRFRWT